MSVINFEIHNFEPKTYIDNLNHSNLYYSVKFYVSWLEFYFKLRLKLNLD